MCSRFTILVELEGLDKNCEREICFDKKVKFQMKRDELY